MRSREVNLARLRKANREIAPGQKFEVRDFDPEDAQGIAALFYAVYGEKFPVDSVYDPEQIIEVNASHQVNHIVGRTESGEVVGLHALFRDPPGKHIMEVGSWMVLPAYRKTSLAMRLAQRTLGEPPAHLELHVIYTQNVCDHLVSQKAAVKFKFISCALELEAMPPRPEDAQGGAGHRISLLDEFMMRRDVPHAVRLPAAYADTLHKIYTSRGLNREFVADGPPQNQSRCSVQSMDAASLVKMTIDEVGRDLATHLGRLQRDYQDRHVLQLLIPLWQPGVSLAVEAARDAGFFLGGLLPQWADRDMLLMQKLRTAPDYSRVRLHTQEAKDLLDMIAADRASLPA
jgi:RimJ/RimL family protein N-acetyltransferase